LEREKGEREREKRKKKKRFPFLLQSAQQLPFSVKHAHALPASSSHLPSYRGAHHPSMRVSTALRRAAAVAASRLAPWRDAARGVSVRKKK